MYFNVKYVYQIPAVSALPTIQFAVVADVLISLDAMQSALYAKGVNRKEIIAI